MSEWYDAKIEDMNMDDKEKEIDIYVHSNDNGAVYVTVQIEDIKKVIKNKKKLPKLEKSN